MLIVSAANGAEVKTNAMMIPAGEKAVPTSIKEARAKANFDKAVKDAENFAAGLNKNSKKKEGAPASVPVPTAAEAKAKEPKPVDEVEHPYKGKGNAYGRRAKEAGVTVEEIKVSSAELEEFKLSDEQIAERCKQAIRDKLEMVEAEDGRRIPACVHTYETTRAVAEEYSKSEKAEVEMVQKNAIGCEEDGSQAKCLNAGRELASDAVRAHKALVETAVKGEERLVQVIGTNE